MKKINEIVAIILLAFVIFLTLNRTSVHALEITSKPLYTTENFELFGKDSNLIINSLSQKNKNLVIDAYFLNTSDHTVNELNNFTLLVKDAKGNVCLDAVYPKIPIKNPLKPKSGVKINLVTPSGNFDANKLDFSSISYSFNYEYK